jgi:arginase
MGLAALLGHGRAPFIALCGGVLRPEHVCYIGARSWEEAEMSLLRRLGVRIIEMAEVKRRGIAAALGEAVAIATAGTAAFGVSVDLDGFDPEDAPGIGLREPDGLRARPALAAPSQIAQPSLAALELVECVPDFDQERRTAHLVRDLIQTLLAASPSPFVGETLAAASG